MSALDEEPASIASQLGERAHNVLLSAPSMDDHSTAGCRELLTIDRPAVENVLHVSFVRSPDEQLRKWETMVGPERPARTGFVAVGDSTRSGTAARADGGASTRNVTVKTVSTPGNLTDLGIQVSSFLAAWADDDNRTVVCFDSLTTMLQYVDLERAFRFLHVLTGRVRSTRGFAHYHVDPGAHEPRTLNTLKTLFDGVAEWNGDSWTVRNR